jgi:hypothetical protein
LAMQSATAALFRALVMLACLVAIPLAAVVGKALPDLVTTLLDRQWPGRSTAASGPYDEAPPFDPGDSTLAPLGFADGQTDLDRQQPVPWQLGPQPAGPADPPGSAVTPTSHEVPVGPPSSAPVTWPSGAALSPGLDGARPTMDAPGGPAAAGRLPGSSDPPSRVPSTDERFTYIQDRLRQLGATYYVLESWGNQEHLYRFYCKVAIGGNPDYTCYFEATDSDPLGAMAQVLTQVEDWRAARRADSGSTFGSGRP